MSALFGDSALAVSNDDVARMTRPEREARVTALIKESHDILADATLEHVYADGRRLAAWVLLFSGGNDSTVLAHLFRETASHAAHANTTIGIEQTREFVRNTCEEWGLPLLERTSRSERDSYRSLVLAHGFPGPGHHFKMFQRLKERALEQVRRELVSNPYKERVVFIAGRRRTESKRREAIPVSERRGSTVWVSPLINWTKLDLVTYRRMAASRVDVWGPEVGPCGRCAGSGVVFFTNTDDQDLGLSPDLATPRECPRCKGSGIQPPRRAEPIPVPVNEVSDLIHMSGECLCGSFASAGERGEVSYWFPEVFEVIAELEAAIADRDDIPPHRKTWGWGADPLVLAASRTKPSKTGLMCSSCDDRFQSAFDLEGIA